MRKITKYITVQNVTYIIFMIKITENIKKTKINDKIYFIHG